MVKDWGRFRWTAKDGHFVRRAMFTSLATKKR